MSWVNDFKQEQQTEPDHANNGNQTGWLVSNLDTFLLKRGKIVS